MSQECDLVGSQISTEILKTFADLLKVESSADVIYETEAIAGCGENSYGAVMKVKLMAKNAENPTPLRCVLKIAPKNAARRAFMRVADFYKREVFVYAQIFPAYRRICVNASVDIHNILPEMLAHSLADCEEFIIFEDLSLGGFMPSFRKELPTFEMVEAALQTLAKLHAMSFVLQTTEPELFAQIKAQLLPDNLFTPDIPAVSVDFGKSYLRRARDMLMNERATASPIETTKSEEYLNSQLSVLSETEARFKEIGLNCVDGAASAPFAVVCHGDFWMNNIMNKIETNSKRVLAIKLVDFQMSRYASPVLDLVHYLFICLDGAMREEHFEHFLNESYYDNLAMLLKSFNLNADQIYPRSMLHAQLKSHGAYGLCMAAFSLPFFVADQTDLLDLDAVAETVENIGEHETADNDINQKVIDDFDLLTSKTAPIFKRRMLDIVDDMIKHKINTKI